MAVILTTIVGKQRGSVKSMQFKPDERLSFMVFGVGNVRKARGDDTMSMSSALMSPHLPPEVEGGWRPWLLWAYSHVDKENRPCLVKTTGLSTIVWARFAYQ
jgi:hypothetical protein